MRKLIRKRRPSSAFTIRNFIRKYGPPILLMGLVYLGIEAFHAFIEYLKQTWDLGALFLAVSALLSLIGWYMVSLLGV